MELDKFKLPKLKSSYKNYIVQEITLKEKEIDNENINPIRARQLSYNKIKSYSLENKIKILLFNSKFFFYYIYISFDFLTFNNNLLCLLLPCSIYVIHMYFSFNIFNNSQTYILTISALIRYFV